MAQDVDVADAPPAAPAVKAVARKGRKRGAKTKRATGRLTAAVAEALPAASTAKHAARKDHKRTAKTKQAAKRTAKTARAGKRPATAAAQRVQVSAEHLPRKSLEQALRIARALRDVLAGGPARWPEIASAMGLGAGNQVNKYFLWSAHAYGLIEKDEDAYSLSEIGRKILAPTRPNEDKEAQVRALLSPVVFSRFLTDYNGNPFPSDEHIGNVLESRYGVPRERTEEATALLKENGLYAGVLRMTDAGMVVHLDPATTGLPTPSDVAPPPPAVSGTGASPTEALDYEHMCFVITPIGEDDSEQRRHANMILKNVIEPVAEELGLIPRRADQIDRAGLITKQIFECLAKARICVADLSFNNPNAFYELGVRHMCKLPTVQMIRKGDRIPFDVSQGRTIKVDMTDVYTVMESVESAKRELRQHLRAALAPDYKGEDNPINTYLPGTAVTLPRA